MMFEALPYTFYDNDEESIYFWVHFGLVILGFILAIITCIVQWRKPAPYGKHDVTDANWGPMVNQRLSHFTSDAGSGVLMFTLVFFLYSREESDKMAVNYVFFGLFLVHTIHRGIIHPFTMKYKNEKVPIGICLGTIGPNVLYQGLIANHIGVAKYDHTYPYDPRLILGVLLYVVGFIINRWADWKLRSLRKKKGASESDDSKGYYIPHGFLFNYVANPNYFGELVQWIGWTVMTWSLSGFVWMLFSAATFFARSRHNLQWYQERFEDYPSNRKALIPFMF